HDLDVAVVHDGRGGLIDAVDAGDRHGRHHHHQRQHHRKARAQAGADLQI
ncbi:conserved hypothetical protein, partial [Ricinus communis]